MKGPETHTVFAQPGTLLLQQRFHILGNLIARQNAKTFNETV